MAEQQRPQDPAPVRPSQSVEVPAPVFAPDPQLARDRARRWFLAAYGFATIAWLVTLGMAIWSSETNGIRASWVAIFPSSFGSMGLILLKSGRSPARALLIAFVSGLVAVGALFVFFEGIWPSL